MTLDLEDLQRLAEAASPGPWSDATDYVRDANNQFLVEGYDGEMSPENVAYIAAANPEAVLALIAELKEARDQIAMLKDINFDLQSEDSVHMLCAEKLNKDLRAKCEQMREALGGALECAEGLMTDFEGCTDNPSDASRLHEWDGILHERFDWMDDARKALAELDGGA